MTLRRDREELEYGISVTRAIYPTASIFGQAFGHMSVTGNFAPVRELSPTESDAATIAQVLATIIADIYGTPESGHD